MSSNKIMCPACGFEFVGETDSNSMCECPNCESMLYIQDSSTEHDFVIDFEECVMESWKIQAEAINLDDTSLEDEISESMTTHEFIKGSFIIFSDMDIIGSMTPDSRQLAEGAYILIHTKKYFGYEH